MMFHKYSALISIQLFAVVLISKEAQVLAQSRSAQYFEEKPTNTSVILGESVVFRCKIGNHQSPLGRVQWVQNDEMFGYDYNLPAYPRYKVIGDHYKGEFHLQIENATIDDIGKYECQASPSAVDQKDSLRAHAHLSILIPPDSIYVIDQNVSKAVPTGEDFHVHEDSKIVLVCRADGAQPAPMVNWMLNNIIIKENVEYYDAPIGNGMKQMGESRLTLNIQRSDHRSVLSCEARHPALKSSLRADIPLNVLFPSGPPEIEGYQSGKVVKAGERLKLVCRARNGNPTPQLVWYKGNQIIGRDSRTIYNYTENNYEFMIEPSDDQQSYECRATSIHSSVPLTDVVQLAVEYPPSQVQIMGQLSGSAGETVKLSCQAGPSNPPAKISWIVDGRPNHDTDFTVHSTPGFSRGMTTLSNISVVIPNEKRDINVHCSAVNDHFDGASGVKSTQSKITVLYPPDSVEIYGYNGHPQEEGNSLTLTCLSSGGNPKPELHWFIGHKRLTDPEQVSDSLSSHNAQSQLRLKITRDLNSANITCRAENSAMSSSSQHIEHSIRVTVYYAPIKVDILTEPKQLKAGDLAIFHCDVSEANPAPVVTWWRNDVQLKNAVKISETHKKSGGPNGGFSVRSRLNIHLDASDDGKVLTCKASNGPIKQIINSPLTLDVKYKPIYVGIAQQQTLTVLENESLAINITAIGNPREVAYAWMKDGGFLTATPRLLVQGPILNVSAVKREDAGIYSCDARNGEGSTNISIGVVVKYSASIIRISDSVRIRQGDVVELECGAEAYPQPENFVHWEREGYNMSRVNQSYRSTSEGHSTIGIANLHIEHAQPSDTGIFVCLAFNGVGDEARRTTVLLILHRPQIVERDRWENAAADIKTRGSLKCVVNGPDVEIIWRGRRGNLANSSRHTMTTIQKDTAVYEGILTINHVVVDDYDVYECFARNRMGSDRMEINFTSPQKPKIPTGFRMVNKTGNTISLTWTPSFDGGHPQGFRILYRKQGTSPFNHVDMKPSNATFLTVTELRPHTTYLFHIVAFNSIGPSDPSNPLQLTTESIASEKISDYYLIEVVLIALACGFILLLANIILLFWFCRRRKRKKILKEKAATARHVPTSGSVSAMSSGGKVPIYGSDKIVLDTSSGNYLRPDSLYTSGTEHSDREMTEGASEDEVSVRTVIEVDAAGQPLLIERVTPHGRQVFLTSDPSKVYVDSPSGQSYAEALRKNSLQRRIAEGMYSDVHKPVAFSAPYHSAQSAINGGWPPSPTRLDDPGMPPLPPPLGPLRSLSQELHQRRQTPPPPYRNGSLLHRRASPPCEPGHSIPTVHHPNYAEVKPLQLLPPSSPRSPPRHRSVQGSPVLSTFVPRSTPPPSIAYSQKDYIDFDGLKGDLV